MWQDRLPSDLDNVNFILFLYVFNILNIEHLIFVHLITNILCIRQLVSDLCFCVYVIARIIIFKDI